MWWMLTINWTVNFHNDGGCSLDLGHCHGVTTATRYLEMCGWFILDKKGNKGVCVN